jgi:hypothetical protein
MQRHFLEQSVVSVWSEFQGVEDGGGESLQDVENSLHTVTAD